jgi:hypothetical protein
VELSLSDAQRRTQEFELRQGAAYHAEAVSPGTVPSPRESFLRVHWVAVP